MWTNSAERHQSETKSVTFSALFLKWLSNCHQGWACMWEPCHKNFKSTTRKIIGFKNNILMLIFYSFPHSLAEFYCFWVLFIFPLSVFYLQIKSNKTSSSTSISKWNQTGCWVCLQHDRKGLSAVLFRHKANHLENLSLPTPWNSLSLMYCFV